MINIYRATDIWNAIKAGEPIHIRMEFSAQGIVVEDEDIELTSGITIVDAMDSGERIVAIGKSCCRQLTAKIFLNNKTRAIRWKDRFMLKLGVKINNSILWFRVGYFNGTTPRKTLNASVVEYVAYDDMIKFDKEAKPFIDSISVPILRNDFYHALCKYAGVKYLTEPDYPSQEWWEANSIETKTDLMKYETLREILDAMAEATCTNARINANGFMSFIWYGDNQILDDEPIIHTIARTDEFSLEYEDSYDSVKWGDVASIKWKDFGVTRWSYLRADSINNAIDAVVLKDDDNPNGGSIWTKEFLHIDYCKNIYVVESSEFTKYQGTNDAKEIYDRLHSLGNLLPLMVECTGNFNLEAGDLINITLEDGTVLKIPICYRTLHIGSSCTDVIELTSNK